jgi:RNA polymerase-binding transcription factor DksA
MDTVTLASKRTILTQEQEAVTALLAAIAVFDAETGDWITRTDMIDQDEADENNQADASEEADEQLSVLAELENRYRLIMHALSKIENGTYGVCEISGEVIEAGRLEANPAARTCIKHMEKEYTLPLP